jgi:hypothetical protein
VITRDQDGNQDIGRVEHGKIKTLTEMWGFLIYYNKNLIIISP